MKRVAVVLVATAALACAWQPAAAARVDTTTDNSAQMNCFEFPVVVVSAVNRAYPDPTCNQLRYPAPDCLKSKVVVRVEVIDNADGSLNCYGATPTAVYEDVESNYRGQTSLFFPKHQMNVKFSKSTSFVGLPEDKAFILNGPYLDCSLLRNHMAHWLFRATGRYSPRTKHVALFQRETPSQEKARYAGIYLLLEKLSYGPNRVNLAKLDTKCQDVSDLTGGWAWQNDPLSYGAYSPNVVIDQYQNEFGMGERPLLAYPNGGEISQKIRDYFVNTSTGFLPQLYRFLWNNMTNPDALEEHLDLGSFADYILHTEMSLNVDAYRRSTFFFKDRAQTINAGPVWDLNLAYGNGARHNYKDWIFPQYTYWKRLMCNYKLTSLVIQRWKQLRSADGGAWSDQAISDFLDAGAAPVSRQLQKCKSDWTSDVVQCASVSVKDCNGSYEERVESLKQAVLDRSKWMDAHITELYKSLDAKKCSGVGEIPKFNCAPNGDDDGCLANPEKYYSAVTFPPVRKPYTGESCEAKLAKVSGTAGAYIASPYEQPSDDDCWKSAGLYVYPQQKGVRERNLTHFCNGYGTCAQGPGAKCECRMGIRLEEDSCRRIDAESEKFLPAKTAKASASVAASSMWPNHKIFTVSVLVFLVASAVFVARKVRERARRDRLNVYQPVRYGSVEDAQAFVYIPRDLTGPAVPLGWSPLIEPSHFRPRRPTRSPQALKVTPATHHDRERERERRDGGESALGRYRGGRPAPRRGCRGRLRSAHWPRVVVPPERMAYFQRAAPVTAASMARSPSSELSSQRGSNASVPAMDVNENSTNTAVSSRDSKSTPATPVDVDAEGQKANVIKSQDSNSTAVDETTRDSKVLAANGVDEATSPPEQRSKEPESTRTYNLDELMTPELIQKIESQENNCLSPIQVHVVWIGDINEAPSYRSKYTTKGYNLTLQTSAEEILDGFHPYVLKAYRQAVPKVVGFDFLKFAILYKYGGFAVDADTEPVLPVSKVKWPSDCELIFGKEASAPNWEKPVFRKHGGPTYGLARPFQILNWAMAVSKPRNHHIKWMLQTAMMHFLGLRDMNLDLVQDISGSGLMTDYVALLHEREGRSIQDVYNDHSRYFPVQGLCLTGGHMHGKWIKHAFLGSWKQTEP